MSLEDKVFELIKLKYPLGVRIDDLVRSLSVSKDNVLKAIERLADERKIVVKDDLVFLSREEAEKVDPLYKELREVEKIISLIAEDTSACCMDVSERLRLVRRLALTLGAVMMRIAEERKPIGAIFLMSVLEMLSSYMRNDELRRAARRMYRRTIKQLKKIYAIS